MTRSPRPDQIEDLAACIANERWMLLSEPRTGKTIPACLYTWWNWSRRRKKTVWVQPLSIIGKNRQELLDWTEFGEREVVIFKGVPEELHYIKLLENPVTFETKKVKRKQKQPDGSVQTVEQEVGQYFVKGQPVSTGRVSALIEKGLMTKDLKVTDLGRKVYETGAFHQKLAFDAKVLLMSADTFCDNQHWILEYNPDIDLLIGDEWHVMFSTNDSGRTQNLYRAMNRIGRLLPMTGTMTRGRLDSWYPAVHLIEPRYYGNYRAFENMHAEKDYYGSIIGWRNADRLQQILDRHSSKRTFKEVHGEKKQVIVTEYCDMSPKQEKAYREFEDKGILELEESFLDGSQPGVNFLRLRQILANPEIFGLATGERTGRDELLRLHLLNHQSSGKPLLIYTAFKGEQARVVEMCKELDLTVALMNGDTSGSERTRQDKAFRAGGHQVQIGSPAVASFGFTWAHVDHIVYLTLDYFDDNFEQSAMRPMLGGRLDPLLIDVLAYRNTVEDRIMDIIEAKSFLARQVDRDKDVISFNRRPRVQDDLVPLSA